MKISIQTPVRTGLDVRYTRAFPEDAIEPSEFADEVRKLRYDRAQRRLHRQEERRARMGLWDQD